MAFRLPVPDSKQESAGGEIGSSQRIPRASAMLDRAFPALLSPVREVAVIGHDGTDSLMSAAGVPSKQHLSDHLPILLRLDA